MSHFLTKYIFKTILFSLILLSSMQLKAQSDIGLYGGYGYSRYYFQKSNYFEQGIFPFYNAGIIFQYLDDKKLGIQTSVEMTQKGWVENTKENGSLLFKMNFAQLNFLSLFKLNTKKEHGLFIKAGPYLAYSYNSEYTKTGNTDSLYFDYDSIQNTYNTLDYGFLAGLSYKFIVGNGSVQIEAIYGQSLKNILERDVNTIFQSLNQTLFINFAYTYTLSRNKKKVKKKKK